MYKKLPYDPIKDLVPIALGAKIPFVLVVNPSLPVRSVAELVQYAKDNPGKLSFASGGPGSPHHLYGELLKSMTGIEMTHVPYKSLAALHRPVCASMGVGLTTCNPSQTFHWTSYASTAIYAHGRDSSGT
jgi:tripartite-type tricarboxylate transporter receptor subunit TctC